MRKVLTTALTAGLFLLLLSALVRETPGARVPRERAAAPPAYANTWLAPLPAGGGPAAEGADRAQGARAPEPCATAESAAPQAVAGRRDANGRVLTSPRYASSVYQVFRAEAAGG